MDAAIDSSSGIETMSPSRVEQRPIRNEISDLLTSEWSSLAVARASAIRLGRSLSCSTPVPESSRSNAAEAITYAAYTLTTLRIFSG